ncbi:serine-rich adhesin for platelets isoform X2 [Calliphora vicina]|uniref:serine-rich adhesin for platelets isoform X2 n=1 Tax=Calliphora vicina TaxID=7373 RepID=UPI00325B7552
MAKISRRAVASSSSNSAAITSSSSSSAQTSSFSSAAAIRHTTSQQAVSSEGRTNANSIINEGKSARSVPSGATHFIDTPLGGYASASATVTATPYPLRNDGTQFTTTHSNVYAYTTTTGPNKNMPYTASPLPPDHQYNKTIQDQLYQQERDRIRREFFETYDVMTGVRIAATLGGFFGLMVFLIVWKSRSSSNETLKVLKDPKMAAVAAVCMQEEEEREIQEAMVATGMSIYPDEYDTILYRRQRMLSLGNVSAPPMLNRGFRFSSVGGGYSSLLEPPRRFSFSAASGALSIGGGSYAGSRRRSGSETSRIFSNYPMGSSFGTDDYFVETDDELENGDYQQRETTVHMEDVGKRYKRTDSVKSKQGFLEVPLMGQDSRRSSAMTCCSTDSSYLERRCSAFTLGLSNLPPSLQRKCSTASRASSTDIWDYYYPDIQVIQPTPKPSPCPSERSIYEQLLAQTTSQQTQASKTTTTTIAMETSLRGLATVTTASKPASKPITTLTSMTSTTANGLASLKGAVTPTSSNQFIRKHSIAFYDPESAQSGRKQQIHSISADTVDVYPYNQPLTERGIYDSSKPAQSAPPVGVHHGFRFSDSPTEELRLNVKRKIAVMELPRIPYPEQDTPPSLAAFACENNNSFPYSNSAAAKAAANAANSSSISIDSTPLSIDKLNGSGSLGTISAKALFNADKRAPLASLSSFKISSLEYQDSELRSMEEDSVFIDSVADTDEDMQQLSSDSEEASFPEDQNIQVAESLGPAINKQDIAAPSAIVTRTTCPTTSRYPLEKRFSLEVSNANTTTPITTCSPTVGGTAASGIPITASARVRRSLLQRHRTISVSSSDRVALLGQPLKEFSSSTAQTSNTSLETKQQTPLETHFGAIICTNSPPTHPRRAQLLQQYSDPQSLPTTTTTTTNTTEEDTCSTLNTEVGLGLEVVADVRDTPAGGSTETVGMGSSTTRGSTSLTQHSSLNTVVSFGRSSPFGESQHLHQNQHQLHHQQQQLHHHQHSQQKLPISTSTQYDPCASSISDSFLQTKEPLIKMPSSLKSLILQHKPSSTTQQQQQQQQHTVTPITISRSATNLTYTDSTPQTPDDYFAFETQHSPCPSVMLELPLIRLPTEDSSTDNSQASEHTKGADEEHSRSCKSDQPSDPSLPGSSRKWSKETLF